MLSVGTCKSGLLLAALSLLLFGGEATATTTSGDRVIAPDDGPTTVARRRARQKNQKGKKTRPTQKPAETPAPPAPGEQSPAAQEAGVDAATRRGPSRVEFDERLLQGQTNKANAIYLFQRRESALRSLVKKRQHFHAEIDEALE